MKKVFIVSLLILIFTIANAQKKPSGKLVPYTWQCFGSSITTQVPANFKSESKDYKEGKMVRLVYPDSSYLLFHCGGLMKLPFLDGEEYEVIKNKWLNNRRSRSGIIKNKKLFWREDNFTLFLNVAFDKVPKKRVDIFNKVLDAFAKYRFSNKSKPTKK